MARMRKATITSVALFSAISALAVIISRTPDATSSLELPGAEDTEARHDEPSGQLATTGDRIESIRSIRLKIIDPRGNTVRGASVMARGRVADARFEDGSQDVVVVRSSSSRLSCERAGYVSKTISVDESADSNHVHEVVLQYDGQVRGTVVDTSGRAIEGASVSVFHPRSGIASTKTDQDGSFSIRGLAPAHYELSWSQPGYVAMSSDEADVRSGTKRATVELESSHPHELLLQPLLVGAIRVRHAFGLDEALLPWMVKYSIDNPHGLLPIGMAMPEFAASLPTLEIAAEYRSSGYVIPYVAVGTEGTDHEMDLEVTLQYLSDAEQTCPLKLKPWSAWQHGVIPTTIDVGTSVVRTGVVELESKWPIDIVGQDFEHFGVMPVSFGGANDPQTRRIELPEGRYFVAPSRGTMLANDTRRVNFEVRASTKAEVHVSPDRSSAITVSLNGTDTRGDASYNVRIDGKNGGYMFSAKTSQFPLVIYGEQGESIMIDVLSQGFRAIDSKSIVPTKPLEELTLRL